MPAIDFVGIYDTNPARAAEVARRLETVDHPSLEALLERVDAVTVAARPRPRGGRDGGAGARHRAADGEAASRIR